MKITMKKSLAVILSLVMCVSMLFGMNLSAFAADTNTVNYVYDSTNTYIYNWGTRETEATFLSPMAEAFYAEKDVTLSGLLALNGSSDLNSVSSSTLYDKLYNVMATTKYTSYDATRDLFKYTDCQNSGNPSSISSFYSGDAIGPAWDSGNTWNREHVWPNSKSDGGSDSNTRRETDIMMLRPAAVSENSGRSNTAYGESSNFYNPNSESGGTYDLRGDVARIVLYVYVRWGGDSSYADGALDYMWGSSGVIESKDILLKWMEEDPVDTWEMGRNDSTEAILGTRNVFVDYPELAFDLFGETEIPQHTTPSGYAASEGTVGGGSTGSGNEGDSVDSGDTGNTDDTTQTTEVEATIDFTTTTQRVSQDTSSQVWTNDGLTFTNDKASSTTNVANYSNPVRIYAKSSITLEHTTGTIKSITFAASGSSYVTPLKNSVGTSGTVTTSGNNVTIVFDTPVESYTIASVTAQIRLSSITATVVTTTGSDSTAVTITPIVNNAAYGSVELSGNYIIATPNEGYEVVGYEVTSGTATVTQNGNNFTVEADADVTVQINFAPRTQYTATFKEMGETTSTQNAYSGDSITLPALTSDDYTVVGWVAAEIDGETTDKPTVYNAGSAYILTGNVTFYALYSRSEAGGSGGESDVFAKYTGAITEGDYLIVYEGGAMKAAVVSSRLSYTDVTDSSGSITSPDTSLIWTITADGDYYTLYNESTGKYAAGTGAKNKAQLLSAVEDKARWTVSGTATYEFVNKANAAASVNANLRKNGTYGFACYSTSTGGALTLYKRTAAAMTTYYFTSAGVTPDYTVTANANDDTFGTVTVSGTTISATPNEGYTVAGYSIASGTATVTPEGNTFFVTPTSDVVITVNFEALPTYTVTFVENGTEVGTDSTYSGGFIKLPEYSGELDEYTTFNGWAEAENETDSTKIYAAKATYAVTKNVTLYAQFTVTEPDVPEESDHYFTKVTENLTDWTGTYLIVYEAGNIAFNAAMADKLDAVSNGVGVTIADGKIAATDANIAVSFVVEKIEGGYTIRSKSGLYFGSESDTNSLLSNATKTYFNNFAIDADGNITITGEGGAILRYNATSGQDRFRFYKTSSYTAQQPIALYKLDIAELSGAQVTVGADLTIKYYVDVTNIAGVNAGDLTMRFSIDGTVIDTVTGTVVGSQYVFDFAGLAPQRMTDIIKAEVLYKGTLIDVKDDYSIKTNAQNLLTENSDNPELCQFITDMLYYGAAAQKYTKYNTDNLATDGVTGLGEPFDVELSDYYNKFDLSTTTGDAAFRSATVWFDSTNSLIVKVAKKTEDVDVKVYVTKSDGTRTELSYNNTVGGYMTDEILATQFDDEYVFELCDSEGNVIQTLKYSVNSYAYSIYKKYESDDTSTMKALALALFRLGQSAADL